MNKVEQIRSLQDKCDGCNNIRGCITCKDGSEWAHYEEQPISEVLAKEGVTLARDQHYKENLEVKGVENFIWNNARATVPEDSTNQIICIKEDGLAVSTIGKIVNGTVKWAYLDDLLNTNSFNVEVKVSEDLGEYINELSKQFPDISFAKLSRIAVRAAKWQEEHLIAKDLAALLNALPKIVNNETLFIETSAALWHIGYRNIYTARADNLTDACYDLLLKLHELKMLLL